MTRSPLQFCTCIMRSSALLQASSSLSIGRTCAWPRRLPVTEMHFCHFSRELVHNLRILYCFCLMPPSSRFQYPSLYTVPVSRLVINAECCTLTIHLMHCGVHFLLCEVFNYTFPLFTLHLLVFELYSATPWHCPDQFYLLRLWCILT